MKPTSAKVFIDSNVLIYSYSNNEPAKQIIARNLIAERTSFISTQVLQEFVNILIRKFKLSFEVAQKAAGECCLNNNLHINTEETILHACSIAEQYRYSFYDSLIISAALECGYDTLYSEDMHHAQKIGPNLTIFNPFS